MPETAATDKEPQVRGISAQDYGLWRQHPVSKLLLQFLRDKRAFLSRLAMEQWLDGSALSETVRGQIIEMQELENLDFASVLAFYQEQEAGNGTEGR